MLRLAVTACLGGTLLLLFAVDVRKLSAVGLRGYFLPTPRLLPSSVVIDIASVKWW